MRIIKQKLINFVIKVKGIFTWDSFPLFLEKIRAFSSCYADFESLIRWILRLHTHKVSFNFLCRNDEGWLTCVQSKQFLLVYLTPIIVSYALYVVLMLLTERRKFSYDQNSNERSSYVFNRHRSVLLGRKQVDAPNVLEPKINLSDLKKWKDIQVIVETLKNLAFHTRALDYVRFCNIKRGEIQNSVRSTSV